METIILIGYLFSALCALILPMINDIKILIELCLSKCYFLWNHQIHELENSGPIGVYLMVVIAESFLQYLVQKAIHNALQLNPSIITLKSFFRYVDDIHARFSNINEAEIFRDILNKQHPNIQYTLDPENDEKELNFIDLTIKNNQEGHYEFSVYRKYAIINIQVKHNSNHDPKVLRGIFKGFVHRAFEVCSSIHLDEKLEFLINVFRENGYQRFELEKIINEVKSKINRRGESINTGDKDGNPNQTDNKEQSTRPVISLTWLPGVSPKLRRAYKKAGYKVMFKSPNNLQNIYIQK